MQNPKISVIVPVYNYQNHLRKTLISIREQTFKDYELIVVDDCSTDNSAKVARELADKVIVNKKNSGPAVSRNKGIKAAKSDIIVFIDSDCMATKNWLSVLFKTLNDSTIDAVIGDTKIPKSTFIGDSISALGFPGGANAGFANMFIVDKNNFTNHITTCNFAARKKAFDKGGYFDETFPYAGGEDIELAYRWEKNNVIIKFDPKALIYHEPRTSFKSFTKWMINRGKSIYYYKQKVGINNTQNRIWLRVWSSKNIILKFFWTLNIFLIVPLIFISYGLQLYGYIIEKYKNL